MDVGKISGFCNALTRLQQIRTVGPSESVPVFAHSPAADALLTEVRSLFALAQAQAKALVQALRSDRVASAFEERFANQKHSIPEAMVKAIRKTSGPLWLVAKGPRLIEVALQHAVAVCAPADPSVAAPAIDCALYLFGYVACVYADSPVAAGAEMATSWDGCQLQG